MSESEDYIDSLDRLTSILRDQIALARAVKVGRVGVTIEDLERLLDTVEGDSRNDKRTET